MSFKFISPVSYAAETYLHTSRAFVGESFRKFEIFSPDQKNWKEEILKKIPVNQLSPKYGGGEGWEPLPLDPSRE